jgi:transcriptional regulator with XRE-family HTH domain
VRLYRDHRGWSQEQLAQECQRRGWDISRDTVAIIESRQRRVDDIELRTLASVLGAPIQDLVPP